MSTKEQYWKYSLITIILVMGVVIFFKATPFLGGLLGAATIYILLRNQMLYLIEKKHMKKSLMATLMLIETILIFLIPMAPRRTGRAAGQGASPPSRRRLRRPRQPAPAASQGPRDRPHGSGRRGRGDGSFHAGRARPQGRACRA